MIQEEGRLHPRSVVVTLLGLLLLGVTAGTLATDKGHDATALDRIGPVATDQRDSRGAFPKGIESIFSDGFEARFVEPDLRGRVRFTVNPHFSIEPAGTQLETLSPRVRNETSFRFLQLDTGLLGRVSPDPEVFEFRADFDRIRFAPGGLVEAPVAPVDLSLEDPEASTSGCEPADFDGFPAGHIALIQRGTCSFRTKGANADAAGAAGIIIFNQGTNGRLGLLRASFEAGYVGTAPAMGTTFDVGVELASQPGTVVRMRVDAGLRSNAWELVPVALDDAAAPIVWIRNASTGQLLSVRSPDTFNGTAISTMAAVGANTDPADQTAWWIIEGQGQDVRFRNFVTNEYATVVADGVAIRLFAALPINISRLCPEGSCDRWRLDERFERPPVGTTRLRTALGDRYLNQVDRLPEAPAGPVPPEAFLRVDRIKPGQERAQWVLEPVPNTGFRRLKNESTGAYLHVEFGSLEAGEIQPGWFSAMWTLEPVSTIGEINVPGTLVALPRSSLLNGARGYFNIRNRFTNELLVVGAGTARVDFAPVDALRSLWVLDDEPIAPVVDANLRAIIAATLGLSSSSDILSSEAAGLYELFAGNAGIATLAGIESFFRLQDLRLPGNGLSDLGPLSGLTDLAYVDLLNNPIESTDGLDANQGLAEDDRVVLLRSGLGEQVPGASALVARGVEVVPHPGLFAMHQTSTDLVVDRDGDLELVDRSEAGNGAGWLPEFDPQDQTGGINGQQRFHYRIQSALNVQSDGPSFDPEIDGLSGYLTWNRQENRLEFTGNSANPEWVFEGVTAAAGFLIPVGFIEKEFFIRNDRISDDSNYLLVCGGGTPELQINVEVADDCVRGRFFIDENIINAARARALEDFYDPQFAPPPAGLTRIQDRKTREFLHMENFATGTVEFGRVQEGWFSARWRLTPIRFPEGDLLYLIENLFRQGQYLRRDASGNLRASPLPSGTISPALIKTAGEFLFDLGDSGAQNQFITPALAQRETLRAGEQGVDFATGFNSIWAFDGGIVRPGATLELRASQLIFPLSTVADLRVAVGWTSNGVRQNRAADSELVVDLPSNAEDISVAVFLQAPLLGVDSEAIYVRRFDRPPETCLQVYFDYGTGIVEDLVTGEESTGLTFRDLGTGVPCPDEGALVEFVYGAIEQVACELGAFERFVAPSLSGLAEGDSFDAIADGDFDAATEALFGDLLQNPLETEACGEPFRTITYGSGGEVAFWIFELSGEVGLSVDPTVANPRLGTYSSVNTTVSSNAGRLFGLGIFGVLGAWKATPPELEGDALGVGVGVSVGAPVGGIVEVGVGGGLSLWFSCNQGDGPIVSVADGTPCTLREDSPFEGFTIDFGVGVEAGVPLPVDVTLSYNETEVPADL